MEADVCPWHLSLPMTDMSTEHIIRHPNSSLFLPGISREKQRDVYWLYVMHISCLPAG